MNLMNLRQLRWLALIGVLSLVVGGRGRAQERHDGDHDRPDDDRVVFNGQINDHTVAMFGSWEIHGPWTLNQKARGTRADFSAALSMERSDLWFLTTSPVPDPNSLTARNAHTHHNTVADAIVTAIPNGIRVTGPAALTGNGATPPFGTSSTMTIDITGGNLVPFSNITLTFAGDAAKHFGTDAIAGVVSSIRHVE
jgi:hypothetical protein